MTAESRMLCGYIWLNALGRKQGDAVGRHRERVETRGEYEGYDVGVFETA